MIEIPSARDTLRELTIAEIGQVAGGHNHGHCHSNISFNINIITNFYISGSNNIVGVDLTGLSADKAYTVASGETNIL